MTKTGDHEPLRAIPPKTRRCLICGKPVSARHQPFCSARCANIDLGRWLNGNYRIASEEAPEDSAGEEG